MATIAKHIKHRSCLANALEEHRVLKDARFFNVTNIEHTNWGELSMNGIRIAEEVGDEPISNMQLRFQQINDRAEELGEVMSPDALDLLRQIHTLRPGIMLAELLRVLGGPAKPDPRTAVASARLEPGGAS
jgi:hypothetical protein